MPSKRAVTCTSRCRFSRRISVWPGISVMLASAPMVAVFPVPLTSGVLRMASSDARVSPGSARGWCRTRSLITTGAGAGSPCSMALASSSTSCALNPARAVTAGSTLNTVAGPLMVFSMPSSTSTTPGIFLMVSPTRGAHWFSTAGSCEKSLMTTGSGALVRSPIMSCRSCGNSTSSTGSAFRTLGAHVGDHLVAAAAALALQLDGNIAGVGFGDRGQAQLQAGAARSAFHFRRGAQDLLHVGDHAIGFFAATNRPA